MRQNVKSFLITVFIIAICCVHAHASDSMLKWDASTGDVSGYTIYYGLSQGSYPFSEDVGNVTQYSLNNFSLSEGTTYYFVVRAYNAAGESGDSNVTTYAVPSAGDTTPPLPPEGVSGEIVNEDIFLTWQTNSEIDISGYRVYYGTSSRDYGLPLLVDGTEYSITGLESDVTYYFVVTAVDSSGNESGYSFPEIMKTIIGEPVDTQAPVVSIGSPTSGSSYNTTTSSIDISGTASDNTGVTGVVWLNSAGGSGTAIGTDSWSVSDIELVEGDNVIIITAKDAAGNESTDTITVTNTLGSLRSKVFGAVSGADFPQTCEDTYLNAGSASTNTSNSSVSLNTYTWPADTAANRIVMNWDVSVLPQDAVISKATLSLYMFGYEGTGGDAGYEITAHRIINHKPVVSTCTWNTYNGTNTWTGGNNGGELDLATAEVGVIVDKNVGYKEFDITNMVKGWVADPSANFGLMLNSDSTAASDSNRFFRPTEYSEPGMRPKLVIEYYGVDVTSTDTTAPVVTITSPTTGTSYGTESESLNLGGTASDVFGVTTVSWTNSRGVSGTATGTNNWSVAGIILSEGENLITIIARDEAGNISIDTLIVEYIKPDTTAPVVTITSPTSATTYGVETSRLNIAGTASDAEGIAQVSWSNSRGGSGTATGTDNWIAADIDLGEGENLITITARDEAGNASKDTLIIKYTIPDITAPVVTIIAPTTGTSYGTQSDSINLSGTASDAIGISSVTWSNSRGGSGTATGTDNWSAAGIPLSEGDNVITITAKDEAGNAVTDILTVTYTKPDITAPVVTDTQPPVLELINPSTRKFFFTRKATIILSGTASDNIGVKEVKWINAQGGNGVAIGTANWEAVDVPLARWWNNITITAEDEAGNKTAYNLTVFLWK